MPFICPHDPRRTGFSFNSRPRAATSLAKTLGEAASAGTELEGVSN